MIVGCIERQVFAEQLLVFRDEGPPDAQAGDDILEIGSHADADLFRVFRFERVDQFRLDHHVVNPVRQARIIGINRCTLFIWMNLHPVLRKNFDVLHVIYFINACRECSKIYLFLVVIVAIPIEIEIEIVATVCRFGELFQLPSFLLGRSAETFRAVDES